MSRTPEQQIEALDPKWQYYMTEDGRYYVYPTTVLALMAEARRQSQIEALERLNHDNWMRISDGLGRSYEVVNSSAINNELARLRSGEEADNGQ